MVFKNTLNANKKETFVGWWKNFFPQSFFANIILSIKADMGWTHSEKFEKKSDVFFELCLNKILTRTSDFLFGKKRVDLDLVN